MRDQHRNRSDCIGNMDCNGFFGFSGFLDFEDSRGSVVCRVGGVLRDTGMVVAKSLDSLAALSRVPVTRAVFSRI